MEAWSIDLENRIPIGFALGWSYFSENKEYPYNELFVYLGLFGLIFKWK